MNNDMACKNCTKLVSRYYSSGPMYCKKLADHIGVAQESCTIDYRVYQKNITIDCPDFNLEKESDEA